MNFSIGSGELRFVEPAFKKKKRKPKQWQPWEDRELERLYPDHTNHWLADHFSVSPSAIAARGWKLQLKKDPEWKRKKALKGCFKKGHKTWNKGMKGLRMAPETEFRPGNKPTQTKFDGAISIRNDAGKPYYFIRLAESHWVPLHRHIWENVNEKKVPDDSIIRFKDGNTLNLDLDNLLLVTRRENALMNVNRKKQSQTMRAKWKSIKESTK